MRSTLSASLLGLLWLVRIVTADGNTDASGRSVQLEFGRVYTKADIAALVKQQSIVDPALSATELESSSKVSPLSTAEDQFETGELSKSPIRQRFQVFYDASCTIDKRRQNYMQIDVIYTGKVVTFRKADRTIDGFGPITVGGGRGRPITSTAQFHREYCYYVPTGEGSVCTYHWHGALETSTTVLGPNPGITASCAQPDSSPKELAGYVSETCVPLHESALCPLVGSGLGATRCNLKPIVTRPISFY